MVSLTRWSSLSLSRVAHRCECLGPRLSSLLMAPSDIHEWAIHGLSYMLMTILTLMNNGSHWPFTASYLHLWTCLWVQPSEDATCLLHLGAIFLASKGKRWFDTHLTDPPTSTKWHWGQVTWRWSGFMVCPYNPNVVPPIYSLACWRVIVSNSESILDL